MQTLLQDVRYGARMLLRKPGFTAIAVVALALGIGANTAIFSVINAVLLRPLPFAAPDRLLRVWNHTEQESQVPLTYPDFADFRTQQSVFERMAAWTDRDFTLTGRGEPLHLRGTVVTADLFPLLRVSPQLGRAFLPEEDKAGGRAVILGHGLWQQRFGSDPNVLGQTITINSQSCTVVGVMPAGFVFPIQQDSIDLWASTAFVAEGPAPVTGQRGNHGFDVVARLKPGLTLAQARGEMQAVAERLAKLYPDTHTNFGVELVPMHADLVRNVRLALLVLFGAVGCVLLIACANVANLLLARAAGRQREIAIRTALGAGRWRVIRQLLTESVLLSFGGGIIGLLLALWGTDLLLAMVPKGLPRTTETSLDARVLGFTLLVSLLTGVLFGLAPAWQASKSDLTEALKEGGKGSGEGAHRNRVRSALVVAEVAIALMLLVCAGLLVNSFMRLQRVNPGFDTHNVLTFRIGLPGNRYQQAQVPAFYQQLVSRLETLPGVKSVSAISPLPLSGQGSGVGFSIEGMTLAPNQPFPYDSDLRTVTPGYFRTMGMSLTRGRDFTARDDLGSTPVAIINETLARRFFPGQDPIGKRINPSFAIDKRGILMREIVGIVSDAKHASLGGEPQPEIYVSHGQVPRNSMTLVVRAGSDPGGLIAAARSEVQALDRELPVFNIKTLDQHLTASVAEPRFNTLLLGLFAALALVLTAVGLYGVMSYSVAQRTHEIGIRMALGARAGDVLRLVVRQGMGLVLVGAVIGLAGAFALTRVMASLLFGVSATDPVTFAAVALLLAVVAFAACYIPARRATRTDPMVALRYE